MMKKWRVFVRHAVGATVSNARRRRHVGGASACVRACVRRTDRGARVSSLSLSFSFSVRARFPPGF